MENSALLETKRKGDVTQNFLLHNLATASLNPQRQQQSSYIIFHY